MRYAIMSDVHANPQALELALADAREQGCTELLMLGDTTGYGYDVKKSMELVRANFSHVLLGNHDSACLGRELRLEAILNPNYDIDRAQSAELTEEERAWLSERPLLHRMEDAVCVHGELTHPSAWNYIMDDAEAAVNFGELRDEEHLLFCGHSHHAATWSMSPKGRLYSKYAQRLMVPASRPESVSFKLKKGWSYIINVGSVGYPRADYCSVYVVFDTEKRQITYRRLPFDFNSYIKSMVSKGLKLPEWLLELVRRAARMSKR